MSTEARVFLVKPGDTLVFGNVGALVDAEDIAELIESIKAALGVRRVVLFEADIDMELVPCG
jgi:carbonic anhydrase